MRKIIFNNKHNFLKEDDTLLSEKWFDRCYDFYNGYALVIKDNKCNYLKKDGTLLSEDWFDYGDYVYNGYTRVCKNKKWNYLKEDGSYLSDVWFDNCDNFINGYGIVANYDYVNDFVINSSGRIVHYINNIGFIRDFISFYYDNNYNYNTYFINKIIKLKLID